MVVLPKTKEIDESIYNFLEQFDNYPDVMLDTDFAYYPDEYLITYAFVIVFVVWSTTYVPACNV